MMPFARLLISTLVACCTSPAAAPFVQAIEFPYRSFPQQLWERELVWTKNIGIDSITVPVARGWTEPDTAPLVKVARRLGMKLYLQPQSGAPPAAELEAALATQLESHGGPVVIGIPQPSVRVSVLSPNAMRLSRTAIATHGSLVWTDVEDTRDHSGYHRGAVSFTGDEQPETAVLRRNAVLLHYWGTILGTMQTGKGKRASFAKRTAVSSRASSPMLRTEFMAVSGAGVINMINTAETAWAGDVDAYFANTKQRLIIPNVQVGKGDALFLPVNLPLSDRAFCGNCQALSKNDRLIYATAELTTVEYENGILAMEFSAPTGGEVVLQLTREPSGPFLAGGKPSKFDWDAATMRVKLPIPVGKGSASRTRIGLALAPPDASAFFVDSRPLVISQPGAPVQVNTVTTSYSSQEIAQRSRLILPPGLKAQPTVKGPLQIDYRIEVPPDFVHGDHVQLALEADGTQMGHVRVQLLRPVSVKIRQAVSLHYGPDRELPSYPPLIPIESPAGRSIDVVIRNNSPEIRTFTLEASGEGIEFTPARSQISIGGSMEREVSIRVFAAGATPGIHQCRFQLSDAAVLETPARLVVLPRAKTVSYFADIDSDGQPEYVLENQHLRAVFSKPDGGRWIEFVWKDSNRNVLPENGVELGKAEIELRGSDLLIERAVPAPVEGPEVGKVGEATLSVDHPKPGQTVFSLKR